MLELRKANRRNRSYLWYKLRVKKQKGFLSRTRRPPTKINPQK
jgi:hypothetical protein